VSHRRCDAHRGDPTAAEGAKRISNEHQNEHEPGSSLKPPPATLEIEILANGNSILHAGDMVEDTLGNGMGGWHLKLLLSLDNVDFAVPFQSCVLDV
jgi:hypothetical protein